MHNKENNNIIHGTILYIAIILLTLLSVGGIIYGMIKPPTVINMPQQYSDEQLLAIKLVVNDNATNSISNVIAAATIFFTVLVVVISVFQFIKTKEYENKVENYENKMKQYENKVEQYENQIEEDKKLKEEILEIIDKNEILICILRAESEYAFCNYNYDFFIEIYNKAINIINKYDYDIIEIYELSRLYSKLSSAYLSKSLFNDAEDASLKALKYIDTNKQDEFSKRVDLTLIYACKKDNINMEKYLSDAKNKNNNNFKISDNRLFEFKRCLAQDREGKRIFKTYIGIDLE